MEPGDETMERVIGVLGAGALGLTAAFRLAQRNERVVVLEREPFVGGLASSFRLGDSYLERFYHHIFRSDTDIVRLVEELGLGHRLVWRRPLTSTLYEGRRYPLDSPTAVLRFSPLSPVERLRLGLVVLYLRLLKDYRRLEGVTAAEWLQRWMGPRVYKVVWEPLFRSKFGERYDAIAMPWFWARVHYRSASLGYLRGGFQLLYQALADAISRLGGSVELETEVTAIEGLSDGRVAVDTGRGRRVFDALVVTLPTRVFVRLARGLPEEYRRRYDWGEAYGAHNVVLALDRPLSDVYWLNINDRGYPFLSVVEHTNFMPPEDYGGRHVVYLGNYLPMDHPLYRRSDQEVLDDFLPHLQRINPAFDRSWVREAYVFKAPFAQPIVTVDYARHIPPHETPIPNVYLANMFMVYPQDRGQNYSVRLADRVARLLLEARGRRTIVASATGGQ